MLNDKFLELLKIMPMQLLSKRSYLKKFEKLNFSSNADIVVCIHNAPDDVRRCLDSLIKHTNTRLHRVILVDDGSDIETKILVKTYVEKLNAHYIRNESALGYTRAANQGIRFSTSSFVALLNSDTIVGESWIDLLIHCAISRTAQGIKVGCIGPLSNAASWQSIPLQKTETKQWAVNLIPDSLNLEQVQDEIKKQSPRVYPEVTFVNGFCYLISRRALNEIGLLDEISFPRGYGEEDDFSIRCLNKGFKHFIADDCYIYHAKSKSFTENGRAKITSEIRDVFTQKHGLNKVISLLHDMEFNEDLLRARTAAALSIQNISQAKLQTPKKITHRPTIAWLAPHLEAVGGIRRLIEMTNRLHQWGFETFIVTPDGKPSDWKPILSKVISTDEAAKNASFDFIVFTDPMSTSALSKLSAKKVICYHLAAYTLYRPKNKDMERFLNLDPSVLHVANSKWTAEHIPKQFKVSGIFPGGIDHAQFKPQSISKLTDGVCYGSPRPHKGTKDIKAACRGGTLLQLSSLDSDQSHLPKYMSTGRVFLSACLHEGFNFCPLEAMACGIPVVMTDDGGSREYAVHDKNALVSPPKDIPQLKQNFKRVLKDKNLRMQLIFEGMHTANRFNWEKVSSDFCDWLLSIEDSKNI